MDVKNALMPDGDQLKTLLDDADAHSGPVTMVNLLKFRKRAAYEDGRDADCPGQEAYLRYATAMRKLVEAAGGRFIYGGEVSSLMIGECEDLWDMVGLVEYPSRRVLVQITSSPEFRDIEQHRLAGLEGQLNIECRDRGSF